MPAPRALAALLTSLEEQQAQHRPLSREFLRTAALLLAKLSDLPFHESYDRIDALAVHLKQLNEKRPQAAGWAPDDWRRLARLVFEHRHLATALYLGPDPPFAWEPERELVLPFCARHVEQPPRPGQTRLPTSRADSLFAEAEELIRSITADLRDARQALPSLQALNKALPPRLSKSSRRFSR